MQPPQPLQLARSGPSPLKYGLRRFSTGAAFGVEKRSDHRRLECVADASVVSELFEHPDRRRPSDLLSATQLRWAEAKC